MAFAAKDSETMASCYHNDIVFEDPAFGILKGEKVGDMWRMLCESLIEDGNSRITFSSIETIGNKGIAHWEAYYTFSKTGRLVHNKIQAEFEFKDGLIINHIDTFDLYKWSQQALGISGYLIGWTTFFKKKLNEQTNKLLTKFVNQKLKNNEAL